MDKLMPVNGICVWFNHTKGYGFIVLEDEREVHIHHTAIPGLDHMRYLMSGDKVVVIVGERESGFYVKSLLQFTRGI